MPRSNRKFYKAVEKRRKGFQPRVNGFKSKERKFRGEDKKKILERWVEHFTELLVEKEHTNEKLSTEENETAMHQEQKESLVNIHTTGSRGNHQKSGIIG